MSSPREKTKSAWLRQLVDAVPDVLLLCRYDDTNAEAPIVAVNRTAMQVLGMSEEELIGVVPRTLIEDATVASSDIDTRRAMFAQVRRGGVYEYPNPVRMPEVPGEPHMRIRMVWPDPDADLVLVQAELLPE